METPLSTRRVTRSQTAAASASSINKNTLISKRSDESNSKSAQRNNAKLQQQETSSKYALLDITNNSPIVGVAKGNLLQTPSSSSCFGKKSSSRRNISTTPGSGEALLRDQVKTLLQKVEEEAELSKVECRKPSLFHHHFQGFVHSPMGLLLAPTPTNTPQVLNASDEGLQTSLTVTYPKGHVNLTSQVVVNDEEEEEEAMKSQITRSLLLDFSDKSEVIESCLSEEDCSLKLIAEEEDSSSGWSVQANASSTSHDEEVENGEGWSVVVDELCLGIENMEMEIVKGNHKRFIYNSDDDIVAEEVEEDKLKGLPTPQGKHIRFEDEEEDDANTN